MIAENNPIYRSVLQASLEARGYKVVAVDNGHQAWELLERDVAPDLLIHDCTMPGVDGIELCRRIRAQQGDRYQYILLISGKDEKREVVQGLDAGADDYLTKPFDIGELHARVRAGDRILLLQRNLMQALEALRYQATHDDLIGLWVRGTAMHLLKRELERGPRSRTPTGVLLIDLDHFKKINDTYGHLTGDTVLKEVASRIGHAVRSCDFVGRYGGEEFLVVLSNCTTEQLRIVAERVQQAVAERPIATEGAGVQATASIGGAVAQQNYDEWAPLAIADSTLYEAKRSGRNRVIVSAAHDSVPITITDTAALLEGSPLR